MNKNFTISGFISITSIAVGILGVIGPIAWDFYKTKLELEVRALDHTILIGPAAKIDGLAVTYKNENLEQLSKTIIAITNTGRTPILEKDVVKPLTITFDKLTQILEVRLESTVPPENQASITYSREKNEVIITVPLMNPGDSLKLNVLAKTEKIDFDASARIAGLTSVAVEKSGLNTQPQRNFPWLVVPVGGFSLLLALVSLVGFGQAPREFSVKRKLRQGQFVIPPLATKMQALHWIEAAFYFSTSKDRNTFKSFINTLPDVENFSDTYSAELLRGAQHLVDSMLSNLTMAIIVMMIACLGIWYSANILFTT